MSSGPLTPTQHALSRRRGVAMITTVVAAAAAASIVLVLVHLSLSDLRSAAAAEEIASARAAASAAIADVATELSVEPSYWAEQVHPRERARVCIAQALAPVVQPGSPWPAECGATWAYTDPEGSADARVEIHPPAPGRRELVINAVGRSGDTLAARAATFTQPTAGAWTLLSMSDLDLADVEQVPDGTHTIRGASVYSRESLDLPEGNATFERSILAAEGPISGVPTPEAPDPEDEDDPEGGEAPAWATNRYYSGTVGLNVGDIRDLVPTKVAIGQLRTSVEVARLSVCRGGDARIVEVDGKHRGSHLCLRRSVRLRDANGANVRVPADTEAYLLITRIVGGEPRVAVYTAGTVPTPAASGDLRANAAGQVAAGTHPGVADASLWRPLGEFDLPATGVITTDRDAYLGACGTGFVSGGACDTQAGSPGPGMAVGESVTVIAGSDAQPHDIYIGSPIHSTGGLLGAVAFGKVHVAYWARPAQSHLTIDAAIAALGADDGHPGFRQFPYDTNPGGQNRGGSLTVTGSVADSDLDLSPMTQFERTIVEAAPSDPPPHFPATRRQWVSTADRPASLNDVCGNPTCHGWLGGGSGSGDSGDTTPPAVPNPVTVSAGPGSAQVTWPHDGDADLYRVFWVRSSGGAEHTFEVHASTCASTCTTTIDGLTNGVRYRVQVDATDEAGNTSARTTPVEFTPDGLPGAPTDLVAVAAGPEQIRLEWNRAVSGPRPTGFRVYRDGLLVAQTSSEFWVDAYASPGSTHTYRVRAINDAGESALSDPVSVLVMAGRPVDLTLTAGGGQIELEWETSPGNVDGYRVYRSTAPAWPGTGGLLEDLSSSTTTLLDDGLDDGVRYYYWVTAYNSSGESPPVRADSPTLPAAIADLVAVPVEGAGGRIAASWSAPAGQEVTSYRLYRAGVLAWEGGDTSVNLDGIDPSLEVAYTVRAVNDAGEGPVSNAPMARPVPHAPTSQTIQVSGTNYSGSFAASAGADTYTVQVQRRSTEGTETLHASTVQATTSFSGSPGLTSTQYRVRVRATNPSGNSSYSEWSPWTAYTTPAAPTGFAFTNATSNAISFTWDADVAADSYEVQRQGTSAVSTTSTSYTATGLAASIGSPSTYNFRVRACNANGCSEWTSYASMTTAGYMRLDATSTASDANRSGTDWVVNVPAGVKAVFLQAAGAKGANGATCPGRQAPGTGARGANVRGVITVTPGDTLVARVGKQGRGRFGGWPGGGNGTASSMGTYCTAMGNAGAGGGYTRWVRNGTTVLVAGGGGGGGSANHEYPTTSGGNGGAPGLANGSHGGNGADGGSGLGGLRPLGGAGGRAGGGTAAGGGAAGVTGEWILTPGGNGTAWTGGNSGNYGGGGGGGYGGGGAGGALGDPNAFGLGWGAGGGGGSSYAAAGVTGLTITQVNTLDEGRACISWHGDTTCAGGSAPFVP